MFSIIKEGTRKLKLNGMELPWVKSSKHLGCTIQQNMKMKKDLMEKRAIYINRVNELTQEFHYAHPLTKVKMNNIFNSYFYGSSLWDLFGSEAVRLEKTWNISQRMMLKLPRNSHQYFVEPPSQTPHIKFSLCKRFLKFVESIACSKKQSIKNLLKHVKYDCRTNTGSNLRNMMLLAGEAPHFGSSAPPQLSLQPHRPPILQGERTWHISHASGHGHAQSWFYL